MPYASTRTGRHDESLEPAFVEALVAHLDEGVNHLAPAIAARLERARERACAALAGRPPSRWSCRAAI